MSKGAAAIVALFLFPLGLVAFALVDDERGGECEACEGVHEDCPHCGGF